MILWALLGQLDDKNVVVFKIVRKDNVILKKKTTIMDT